MQYARQRVHDGVRSLCVPGQPGERAGELQARQLRDRSAEALGEELMAGGAGPILAALHQA